MVRPVVERVRVRAADQPHHRYREFVGEVAVVPGEDAHNSPQWITLPA
jgi:hypothetical protein